MEIKGVTILKKDMTGCIMEMQSIILEVPCLTMKDTYQRIGIEW